MKALVLEEYDRLVYRDVPDPEISPDEVLIRVKACGICGSDVHGIDGSTGRRIPPVIMGHEAAGEIVSLGDQVDGWCCGQRVTFDSTLFCGTCHFCKSGQINLCDQRRVLGVSCDEYRHPGAFAEYVAVPARGLYALPDDLSFEKAAMVEPVAIAMHGVERMPLQPGDTALVVGCGIIGLLAIQVLRLKGCQAIIATDLDSGRLQLARSFGADLAIHPKDALVPEAVMDLTKGRGADLALEVVGSSATLATCVDSLRKGGHLSLIGNFSPVAEFNLQAVVSRQISLYGSCASCGQYDESLRLIAAGQIDLDPLLGQVAPLAEGDDWFRRLYQGESGLMKVVLTP